MHTRSWKAGVGLVTALGFAPVLIAVLLCWVSRSVQAETPSVETGWDTAVAPVTIAWQGGVRPAWTSTEPVTTVITNTVVERVWPIPQYGVTVTFPPGSVSENQPAEFTFAPESPQQLPGLLVPTSYFFEFAGVWVINGEPVSLERVALELKYEESELGDVLESTLRAVWLDTIKDAWIAVEARSGSSRLDMANNLFELHFRYLGHYGVVGYESQQYLPFVVREPAVRVGSTGPEDGGH